MFGHRASVAGPSAWNSLPDSLRDPAGSVDCSRRDLKTSLLGLLAYIARWRLSDYALYKFTINTDIDIAAGTKKQMDRQTDMIGSTVHIAA